MASVSVDDMRYLIARVYPSDNWKKRVRRMSDNQVCAIYFSFLEKGKFEKKPVKDRIGSANDRGRNDGLGSCAEPRDVPHTDVFAVDTAEQLYFDL